MLGDGNRLPLTNTRFVLNDCDAWAWNASLTRLSSYRSCTNRRTAKTATNDHHPAGDLLI